MRIREPQTKSHTTTLFSPVTTAPKCGPAQLEKG